MGFLAFMRDTRVNDFILNILLAAVLFLLGLSLYWQLYPYNVLEAKEGNYSLEKTEYKQGEVLNIHFKICKHMDIPEDIYGTFIDGVIYSIPDNSSDFKVGCYDTYISSVSIPDNLPGGSYTYEETVTYRVNPLRTIEYKFSTPEFMVVEN